MVLGRYGRHATQQNLSRQLGCTVKRGTPHKNLRRFFVEKGFSVTERRNATIPMLRAATTRGTTLVNYYDAASHFGHFAILRRMTKREIILADPYYGDHRRLSLATFRSLWHNKGRSIQRWFLTISQ